MSIQRSEPTIARCHLDGELCSPLSKRIGDQSQKGLVRMMLSDIRGNESFVVLYKSHQHETGILINFCPWCGAELNTEVRKALSNPQAAEIAGA